MKLIGYINPMAGKPGFVLPLFLDGQLLYAQKANREKIIEFEMCGKPSESDLIQYQGTEINKCVNDATIYGFWFSQHEVVFGDKSEITKFLSDKVPKLLDDPFLLDEIYDFLGDKNALFKNITKCELILAETNSKLALDWAKKRREGIKMPEDLSILIAQNVEWTDVPSHETININRFQPNFYKNTILEISRVFSFHENPPKVITLKKELIDEAAMSCSNF